MRVKIAVLCLALSLLTANAWAADVVKNQTFTAAATGAGTSVKLSLTGVYNHRLIWTGAGTRTTCTVKLEQSIDNVNWTDLIANQTCTSDGTASVAGWANYVRVNSSSALTGAGNTLYTTYMGEPYATASTGVLPGTTFGTSVPGTPGIFRVVTTTPPTYVEGTLQMGSIDAVGRLYSDISALNGTTVGSIGATSNASMPGIHPMVLGQTAWSAGNCANGKDCALSLNTATGGLRVEGATPDAAEGAAATNPPVPMAFKARNTEMALVDPNDMVMPTATLTGGLIVEGPQVTQLQWQNNSLGSPIVNTDAVLVKAATTNYFVDVTNLLVTNGHASVGTVVQLIQGTGATCGTGTAIIYEGYAAAGGGGFAPPGNGVLVSTTAVSQSICIRAITTGSSITWSMKGFQSLLNRAN
jgi:hypothetical protein